MVVRGKKQNIRAKEDVPCLPVIESRNELLNNLRAAADDAAVDAVMRNITENNIRVRTEKVEHGRVVLSCAFKQVTSKLVSECNGLVLDSKNWRVLAAPPSAFNMRPNNKRVDAYLSESLYDVIRVVDGTVVTLYHYDDRWAISSSNGYDVSTLKWIGPKTYAELLFELFKRIGEVPVEFTETGFLNFPSLDKHKCYTIGFRHHNFQPLVEDPEKLWFIQSCDVSGEFPVILDVTPVEVASLPGQDILTRPFNTLNEIRSFSANSVALAVETISAIRKGEDCIRSFNYGYILRSRQPERTKDLSNILIESPLLKQIRKKVYDRAPFNVRPLLNENDRLEYNAMKAFLSIGKHNFVALYPDWAEKYRLYDEFIETVVSIIVHAITQKAMAPAGRDPRLRSNSGKVAKALMEHICRHEKITAFDKDVDKIVRDYVVNPEYAYLFLRALQVKN